MSDESKAVKELAATAGKAIDASQRLGGFLSKVLGDACCHLGQSLADRAQVYRYENLLRLIDKVDAIHEARRIESKSIPMLPKHALPILDHASLEDDETILDLWAGLVANSTDPNLKLEPKKLYIEILSSLDTVDARVLQYLKTVPDYIPMLGYVADSFVNAEKIAREIEVTEDDCLTSLSNLARNGLIDDHWNNTMESLDFGYSGFSVTNPKSNFRLSHLGSSLLKRCNAL